MYAAFVVVVFDVAVAVVSLLLFVNSRQRKELTRQNRHYFTIFIKTISRIWLVIFVFACCLFPVCWIVLSSVNLKQWFVLISMHGKELQKRKGETKNE